MELAVTENDGGRPARHVLKQQGQVFDSLAKSIFRVLKMEKEMPEELSDSIGTSLWKRPCMGLAESNRNPWHSGCVFIRENRKPGYMAEPVSRYTKAEVILLDCIFEYYVSDPGTFYYDDPPRLI